MDRRRLIAVVGGLVLVGSTAAVLRNESVPPAQEPVQLAKYLDPIVEHKTDAEPKAPAGIRLTALDPDTLRATWTGTSAGYEVRWNGETRLVTTPGIELAGLNPAERTRIEVRSVNATGRRSPAAKAEAVPREVHDDRWDDLLSQPMDRFDGPESLDPRKWRIQGDTECLGLRPHGLGKRLDVDCETLDLQSNVPLRLGVPGADGATGRIILTSAGSTELGPGQAGLTTLALLPEPLQDLPTQWLNDPQPPPGAILLNLTPQGARLTIGRDLPATARQIPISDTTSSGLLPGVRHRWELRILPDAVVALRDGEVVAAEPVAVPWSVARPRISFRGNKHATIDSFGTGGVPEAMVPASVISLGPSVDEQGTTSFGNVPSQSLIGGLAARLVASTVTSVRGPVTVQFGGISVPAQTMIPSPDQSGLVPSVIYADIPLQGKDLGPQPKIRLTSAGEVTAYEAHIVVLQSPSAPRRALPRLSDRPIKEKIRAAGLRITHESGVETPEHFPRGGRVRMVVELSSAGHAGIELDVDDRRLVTLPTSEGGPAAGGQHEFWLDAKDFAPGSHHVVVRVRPNDPVAETVTTETVFEVRKTA